MKLEDARPKKTAQDIAKSEEPLPVTTRSTRSKGSAALPKDVLPGIELGSGRKVKRGWSKPEIDSERLSRAATKGRKSFSGNDPSPPDGASHCLFKTQIPQKEEQRKRKRTRDRIQIVPEFKSTVTNLSSNPSSAGLKAAQEFVDGVGWVDETGQVVETTKTRRRGTDVTFQSATVTTPNVSAIASGDVQDLSAGNASDESNNNPGAEASPSSEMVGRGAKSRKSSLRQKRQDRNSNVNDEIETAEVERLSISRSSGSPAPHSEADPTSAPSNQIHPLETFFKRPQVAASHSHTPKKPHLEVSTSFSFFDANQDNPPNDEPNALMPHTPFTQQDFRHRRQRSAAPTPDTALPGKTFGEALGDRAPDKYDDDKTSSDDSTVAGAEAGEVASPAGPGKGGKEEESEGAKWFYEHRGETNRSWKRRRREATKEKKFSERRAKR